MLTWADYREWLGTTAVSETDPKVRAPELAELSTDSRTIHQDHWFVPLEGPNFDGHRYIAEAISKGARGFFYRSEKASLLPANLRPLGLEVTDTLQAFQLAAAGWRKTLKNLRLLALTGSAGKTTTKEMLASILRADGPTFATLASFNNEVGVPKSLQQLTPDLRYAALEFGARMPGNIKFLCEMAAPDIVGLLNVGSAHLGVFGSIENLLATKLEIFRNCPENAIQIANSDDPRILENAIKTGKKTLTFGTSSLADVRLLSSEWLNDGQMRIRLRLSSKGEITVVLGVAHEMFPINVAAATAMALAAGVRAESIAAGLDGFRGIRGRYFIQKVHDLTVIDDTYNANPESMAAGLKTVSRAFSGKKIILVLGDMLELGDSSAQNHQKIGQHHVATLNPSHLITVGTEAKHLAAGARTGGLKPEQVQSFDNIDQLLTACIDFRRLGNVVYAKGSNGIKLNKLVEQIIAVNK